jgi:hypothetical protein
VIKERYYGFRKKVLVQKSGFVAKSMKTSQLGSSINVIKWKWYTKVRIIVSNCGNIILTPHHLMELQRECIK